MINPKGKEKEIKITIQKIKKTVNTFKTRIDIVILLNLIIILILILKS